MSACEVPGCPSASWVDKHLKFHRIGKERSSSWLKAINRPDLIGKSTTCIKQKYVCSLHFEKWMYGKKNLKKFAVPTINLPINEDDSQIAPESSKYVLKQNTQNEEDTKKGEFVIKYEHPESSEMTIEEEQIGYHETVKRQRFVDSSKDSREFLITEGKTISDVNEDENNYTMHDEHEDFPIEGSSTIPTKKKDKEMEYAKSMVKNKTKSNNLMKTNVPVPSCKKIKILVRNMTENVNKNMKINKNKKKQARERFLLGCDIYLSPQLSSIIKTQLNSKGYVFTNDYLKFCFDLFISSPTTYKFLAQVLCLPSKKDLIKTYFPISSKINKEMLSILTELSIKMSPLDRECVLTFGEIKLEKSLFYDAKADRVFGLHEIKGIQKACVGSYAYTVILKGVATDWKLLIGFSFTLLNELNVGFSMWLTDTIAQLYQIGYKVRAVCCPVLPVFTQIASSMKAFPQNDCCWKNNGNKVYLIFDIRSILKSARNTLMKHTLAMDNRRASWTCVRQLYQVDHIQRNRLVPQLTKWHIKPKKHNIRKLHYASDVIDPSIAVALNIYADKRYILPHFGTIQFINTMNRVFKMLKSDKPVSFSDEEKQLLQTACELFHTIIVRNKKYIVVQHIPFKHAITTTLNSISRLGDDMQSENLIVARSKLMENCMQPFYDVIRKLSGHSKRVTCKEYLRAFRRCFLFYALRTAEKKDKTLTNSASFLANYEMYVRKNQIYQTIKYKQSKDLLSMFLSTPEEERFVYVCSYMLQKCLEKHTCPKLLGYVNTFDATLNSEESEKAGLRVPPDHFLIFCTNLENYLEYSFNHFVSGDIYKNLTKKVKQLYFDKPCKCFPVDFLLKMFVKMRIKYNNMLHNKKWKEAKNDRGVSYSLKFIRM